MVGSADVSCSLPGWLNAAFRLIILSSGSAWSCTLMALTLTTALQLCRVNTQASWWEHSQESVSLSPGHWSTHGSFSLLTCDPESLEGFRLEKSHFLLPVLFVIITQCLITNSLSGLKQYYSYVSLCCYFPAGAEWGKINRRNRDSAAHQTKCLTVCRVIRNKQCCWQTQLFIV